MTYIKWKDEVESYLNGLSEEEKKKVFSYFAEMYADKRDAGKSEEQIIEEFGAPYDVAKKILGEYRESAIGKESQTPTAPPPTYNQSEETEPTPIPAKKSAMRRLTGGKGWLIALCIAVSILVLGLIFFLVDVARNDWKLYVTYTMQEFKATEQTNKLDLSLAAGKMDVVYHDGDSVEVSYPTSTYFSYEVRETNGTVTVKPKSGFHFFMFGTGIIPTVKVRVPRALVLALDFDVSAGDVTIEDMSFTDVDIDVSAGNLTAGRLTCKDFDLRLSAGIVNFRNVACDKADIDVSAGTATVSNIACDKITADVSAGTVSLTVEGKKTDYNVSVSKSAGKINGVNEQTGTVAGKTLRLDVSAGTINVNFTEI